MYNNTQQSLITNVLLQANGLDERFNQTLQNMLVKFVSDKQEHWDDFLDTCVFAYNTAVHESTRFSLFEVMFGRKATLPVDLNVAKQCADKKLLEYLEAGGELSATTVEKLASHRQGIIEEAKANIQQAQEKQKEVYDRKHAHPDAFQVGTQVLKKDFLRKKRANGKMDARYLGPYIITKKLAKGFYALELAADPTRTVSRINGAHLKPYQMPPPTEYDEASHTSAQSLNKSDGSAAEHPSSNASIQDDSIPPLPPPTSFTHPPSDANIQNDSIHPLPKPVSNSTPVPKETLLS